MQRLPAAHDILRGSLLNRVIRHSKGCKACEIGAGHPVGVLTTGVDGKMRQTSLRSDQVAHVNAA